MTNIILFDNPEIRATLLPLTFTRPVACLRIGLLTIMEKWSRMLPGEYSYMTEPYLSEKFPIHTVSDTDDLYIAGHVCPTPALVSAIKQLAPGEELRCGDTVVARRGTVAASVVEISDNPVILRTLPDIFMSNGRAIDDDFRLVTAGRVSQPLSPTCTVIGDLTDADGRPRLFLEPGARVEGAIINLNNGPVYVGRDAEIMEGVCIRGALALCDHSYINMGAKIYGPTTIGPHSKVGGEVNNIVITGYSNKAHDGFLGNSVIGEWCNLGADCVSSNLKNDYSEIRLWNYPQKRFLHTGLQFCGLIMGDHSKAGINTMFNTATVVGVGCNIHGAGFPRTYIPSFSEGGAAGFKPYPLKKVLDVAARVMARRHVELTPADISILSHLANQN